MGVIGVIVDIVISLGVGLILSLIVSGGLPFVEVAILTILVAFSLYLLLSLFFAIFIVPYNKHEAQTDEITKLQSSIDKKAIINRLIALRKEGVEIRN